MSEIMIANTKIKSPKETIDVINDETNSVDIDNYSVHHSNYLFLLFFELIAFLTLFFIAYQALKKLRLKLSRNDDPKFKIVNGLIAANGFRAVSLIIVIILENNSGNSPTAWMNYLAHVLPSMMFVSAYMALLYLLIDYYYSLKNEINHLIQPILRIVVVCGYIIIAIIALISFASKQFKMFMYFSEFIIGVVYIITSSMIIYYGRLIGNYYRERHTNYEMNPTEKVSFFNIKILKRFI